MCDLDLLLEKYSQVLASLIDYKNKYQTSRISSQDLQNFIDDKMDISEINQIIEPKYFLVQNLINELKRIYTTAWTVFEDINFALEVSLFTLSLGVKGHLRKIVREDYIELINHKAKMTECKLNYFSLN